VNAPGRLSFKTSPALFGLLFLLRPSSRALGDRTEQSRRAIVRIPDRLHTDPSPSFGSQISVLPELTRATLPRYTLLTFYLTGPFLRVSGAVLVEHLTRFRRLHPIVRESLRDGTGQPYHKRYSMPSRGQGRLPSTSLPHFSFVFSSVWISRAQRADLHLRRIIRDGTIGPIAF
jgi:hypothetical protein